MTASTLRTRMRFWSAVFAGWTIFAVLSTGQFYAQESVELSAALWWDMLSHILLFYWLWALLTPAVFAGARLLVTGGWGRAVLVVLAAVPVLVVVHGAMYLALHPLVFAVESGTRTLPAYLLRHGLGDVCTVVLLGAGWAAFRRYQRFRERELAASELEARLSQAQLEVLKMQIQPHFLFNVLNTIAVLVMKGEREAAGRAIGRVSDFLRATLALGGEAEIELRRELDLAHWYLDLEEMRFGDRLRVELEIDPEALGGAVPALILQPLVENAVRHGIGARPSGGRIVLSALRDGDTLRLEVRDDGVGRAGPGASPGAGIGLANARERLARLYGPAATLALREAEGGGTAALVTLPYRPARGADTTPPRMAYAAGAHSGDHRR